jgi:hypothetical protein
VSSKQQLLDSFLKFKQLQDQFAPELAKLKAGDQPSALWDWMWHNRDEFPVWYELAAHGVLIQPSSAAIERFFSILKGQTSKKQFSFKKSNLLLRALCLYNSRDL